MSTMDEADPQQLEAEGIARLVVKYFLEHPEGADSMEGLARWRLAPSEVPPNVETLHSALTMLVALDLVEEIEAPGMRTIYRLKRANLGAAEQWLAATRAGEPA